MFTLHLNPNATASVSSVMNNAVTANDVLLVADGNLKLMTVPMSASLLPLGSALIGLPVLRRRIPILLSAV